MQKRYCACGQMVWVQYVHTETGWFSQLQAHPRERLGMCPNCGRCLDINTLP